MKGRLLSTSGCALLATAMFVSSCSKLLDTVESDTFHVEVRKSLDFVDIEVQRNDIQKDTRIVLSIERDKGVDLAFLDDSILVITGIRVNMDGEPSLITNLQNENVPCLTFGVGDATPMESATELASISSGDWAAYVYRMNTRSDMFIVRVRTPLQWGVGIPLQSIMFLSVDNLDLRSITDGLLEMAIVWEGGQSEQIIRGIFKPRGPMMPGRFSVTE